MLVISNIFTKQKAWKSYRVSHLLSRSTAEQLTHSFREAKCDSRTGWVVASLAKAQPQCARGRWAGQALWQKPGWATVSEHRQVHWHQARLMSNLQVKSGSGTAKLGLAIAAASSRKAWGTELTCSSWVKRRSFCNPSHDSSYNSALEQPDSSLHSCAEGEVCRAVGAQGAVSLSGCFSYELLFHSPPIADSSVGRRRCCWALPLVVQLV